MENYDYGNNGLYFITICVKNCECILSRIVDRNVGDGVLDVPLTYNDKLKFNYLTIKLSEYGKIVDKYINQLDNFYDNVKIHNYVIMPNHIHFIIEIKNKNVCNDEVYGTSRTPSPTNAFLPKFISTLKRFINKEISFPIFQRSYYDNIIKNDKMYYKIYNYIENNPSKWNEDKYNPANFKKIKIITK